MEYQNAVSKGQLKTAHCTYNTESLSQTRPVESLVPITVSSSLFYYAGSYSYRKVWGLPPSCPSHQASDQTEESHHPRAQDAGAHHECIFPVPHEGEAGTGVDLGVGIILLNEQPGAVVWGADPVGATMGSLTNSPSQDPPTCPHKGSAVHGVLKPWALSG